MEPRFFSACSHTIQLESGTKPIVLNVYHPYNIGELKIGELKKEAIPSGMSVRNAVKKQKAMV